MNWWTSHLLALLIGFCLDLLLGDPHWAPHPVRAIGALIAGLERMLRCLFPKSHGGELAGGVVLVLLTLLIPTGLTVLLLWWCWLVSPWLALGVESVLCYQLLATKSLAAESRKVYDALKTGDLDQARYAVSMIVGRDTASLDEAGVARAAVETVAENTSDGVTAPLLFLLLGGAPLGFLYKAVNTMDSMLGYKNEKYLYFGRFPAGMDDVFNFIPSRITALLMITAAFLTGMDGKNAWRIYLRDRGKHAGPNAAQTEAVCAGALRIRLAGDAVYFGKLYKKEYLGDDLRSIEAEDIRRAGKLMYVTAVLMLVVFGAVKAAILFAL